MGTVSILPLVRVPPRDDARRMPLTDTATLAADAALLVIDVQRGFRDTRFGRRDNPGCERNIAALAAAWVSTGRPIVRVRHASRPAPAEHRSGTQGTGTHHAETRDPGTHDPEPRDPRPELPPLHPQAPGYAFEPFVDALDPALDLVKHVHSAFHADIDLHAWLQERHIGQLVVCGIQTNLCCETTSRLGGNLGYDVLFPFDATHTFDQRDPLTDGVVTAEQLAAATRSTLARGFATVVSTSTLVAAARVPRPDPSRRRTPALPTLDGRG